MRFSDRENLGVYLDYNATSPLRSEAKKAIFDALGEPSNPSSIHGFGRRARKRLEKSRVQIAKLVGSEPENIIFTSGGTEADSLAIKGAYCSNIVISSIEHDAIFSAAPESEKVAVNQDGTIILSDLEKALSRVEGTCLVSIMWANNETGAIQPMEEIVAIASKYGAQVHADAIQAFGKIPINFRDSGLSMMSISAHKIGGPPGVGALVVADGIKLKPFLVGGGQEKGRRSGTENIMGIVGFGAAAEVLLNNASEPDEVCRLRDLFEQKLLDYLPDLQILSVNAPRLGNTSAVVMAGVSAETQVMLFDLEGIYISAGAACSSGKIKKSHVIEAMGVIGDATTNTIRVSFGWESTESDVDRVVETWIKIYEKTNKKS